MDDAQAVAQPLHHAAAHENGTFQGVVYGVANLPCHGGEQVVLGQDGFFARVHEQEAAGTVGVFNRTGRGAHLAEQGRLLVSGDTGNVNLVREDGGLGVTVYFGRGAYARHHGGGDVQQLQQFLVPLQRVNVEQHGAGGVGHVGDMDFAAGELPDQPAVYGAEAQFAGLGLFAGAGHVVQDPFDLGAREVGVNDETRLFANLVYQAAALELVAEGRCAPVLPYDGIVHGGARFGVPYNGGFPLVGNADGCDVLAVDANLGDGLGNDGGLGRPDFHRVVLYPARLREVLGEFLLGHGTDVSVVVEDDGSGGTGSLIQG